MSELPVQPHELLNQTMKAPPVDPEGAQRLQAAIAIYLECVRPRLQNFETISQESFKLAAEIAVDGADILLKRLAGRR